MTSGAKPFISAFLCEHVLTEKDGTQTYVRVFDTFVGHGVRDKVRVRFKAWLVIILKSGEARGKFNLLCRMNAPSGNVTVMGDEFPVTLNGGEHGANFNIQLVLDVESAGLYGIDLLIDGEMLTSVPFRVRLESALPESERSRESEPRPPAEQMPSGQ